MTKIVFRLVHAEARRRAKQAIDDAPEGFMVTVQEPSRSMEQNSKMWVILHAFTDQLEWPVNGKMVKMQQEDWKDLLSAAFRQETARLAMGLDGGVVMLGLRTSKMGKKEFSEFLEFLYATAAVRGVVL